MSNFRQDFIRFAVQQNVLCFGEFQTKAGRLSPYFFNAGLFNDGASLRNLSQFYAQAILASGVPFDMLFGPAYKGIPLVAGAAIALAEQGSNVPYCYNRKEAKDHGEGGTTVGAKLQGQVLIIDDVISAGTSVRESITLIHAADAQPCGVVIALDRMERGQSELSAAQEVRRNYDIPVISIATLDDLLGYLRAEGEKLQNFTAVQSYRDRYGVKNG
jgi:orotate phosphoribosyltransferase